MDVLLDDLVNGLVFQVQDKVVPTLENVTKEATKRLLGPIRSPPASTDLVYLADRLLVCSQPALAPNPSYDDIGRDVWLNKNSAGRHDGLQDDEDDNAVIESLLTPPSRKGGHRQTASLDISSREMPLPSLHENLSEDDSLHLASQTDDDGDAPGDAAGDDEKSEKAGNISSNMNGTAGNNDNMTSEDDGIIENPQDGTSKETQEDGVDPAGAQIDDDDDDDDDVGTGQSIPQVESESVHQQPVEATSNNNGGSVEAPTSASNTHEEMSQEQNGDRNESNESNDASTDKSSSISKPVDVGTETIPDGQSPNIITDNETSDAEEDDDEDDDSDDDDNDNDDEDDSEDDGEEEDDDIEVEGNSYNDSDDDDDDDDEDDDSDDDDDDDDENDSVSAPLSQSQEAEFETPSTTYHDRNTPGGDANTTPKQPVRNSPGTIATYLEKRHGRGNFLAFSLMDEPPDDRTLLLFRRQIIQLGWWSPCVKRSETPSIPKLLKICYAIHAYLSLDPSKVALVYCSNGKTRTAIAMACYLKFAGLVDYASQGFLHFLKKRGVPNPEVTWKALPPSLHLFFRQFDAALELGGFLNRKPLLLRAIALQGIPVEDKPCLDIWDSSNRHVYSSHPEVWQSDPSMRRKNLHNTSNKPTSQWADEEGFYKVNVVLEGDFLLLCRFGGEFAKDSAVHDPSTILFRYCNTTGFLSGGCPYELRPSQVDLMRRYAPHLDDEDFLVTLLFEAEWERTDGDGLNSSMHSTTADDAYERLKKPSPVCEERVYRSYEQQACEEGWRVIFQQHSARPNATDLRSFKMLHQSDGYFEKCPDHLVCISLQLSNFQQREAENLLRQYPSFSWWYEEEEKPELSKPLEQSEEKKDSEHCQSENKKEGNDDARTNAAEKGILDILDDIDVSSNLESSDQIILKEIDEKLSESKPGERPALTTPKQTGGSTQTANDVTRRRDEVDDPCLRDSGWMVPSIMYPRPRDIVNTFDPNGMRFNTRPSGKNRHEYRPTAASRKLPRVPFFHRHRLNTFPPPSDLLRGFNEDLLAYPIPPYDPQKEEAMQVFMQMRHTGVTLADLTSLTESSRGWHHFPLPEPEIETAEEQSDPDNAEEGMQAPDASMNREAKGQKEKEWEDAKKKEAKEKEEKKAADEEKRKEEQAKRKAQEEEKTDGKDAGADLDDGPLKDHPEYAKYFKMLKMGMAKEQVLHAMKRDDKDPMILDLDPNKSLNSQLPEEPQAADGEVPLKDDPEYEKYFKMLKMGLPVGAVKNALVRDDKDPTIMDLDPNKSLKSQRQTDSGGDDGPALKDDPDYQKYFKMLTMGLPVGAVKNALVRDGKDPGIMDLDPNKSLKSQMGGGGGEDDGPPLKEDPEYEKYFKMLGMGLPIGAVKNALVRDGKDPAIMDLDPNKSVKSQMGGGGEAEDTGPPLKEDPDYVKYFKMLTMGLPIGAVKNALSRDGKDPSIMDLDPNKSLKSQLGGQADEKDTGVPLKDDPDYAKYFKMLGMGLPHGAVKNALERDGKNPAILDMDPNKSVAFQLKKKGSGNKKPAKKKKRVRRKKIYWNPIDPGKLKEDSMWSIVRGSVVMDKLNYDVKEFEDLFTESADPADKKKKKGGEKKKEAKKLVQVIDGKKDMNGGIILARLKMEYTKIADIVDKMEHGKFDAVQLKALKEYLADADERRGLLAFMKKGESSKEVKDKLYSELSETEKYMVTMMEVKNAEDKFDAMFFRTSFKNRFEESTAAIRTLNGACDELRTSEDLRKLMAMILTVVNQINTGGEGKMAIGFTLDALLKLNEAKAFDKKTSVLHYVVKLVKKNDEPLLGFGSSLPSVIPAESVLLDALASDVKSISEELQSVHETVRVEAERLEKAGELKPMTLADLAEQRTAVQHVGAVPQYNKMDHLTGRTSMERFTINAKVACDQAIDSIDDVKKKYKALLEYFGEDEQMATGDFFGTFRRFMVEWNKAVEQVTAIEKAEAKEKKRAAAKAAKKAKDSGKAPAKEDGKDKSKAKPDQPEKKTSAEGGGIAGLAAAAAAAAAAVSSKVAETKPDPLKEDSKPQKPAPPNGGGIAALAAAAAASKKKTSEKAKNKAPNEPGGIAAIAAAAALKKTKKAETKPEKPKKSETPTEPTGIAALAAQAATNKAKAPTKAFKRPDKPEKQDSAPPILSRRSWETTTADKGNPLRRTKSTDDTYTKGSPKVPEYKAAASSFQRRNSGSAIYDEKGEPINPTTAVGKNAAGSGEAGKVPEYADAASRFQKRSSDKAVYDEKGEPIYLQKKGESSGGKSAFAAKAAAYRRRKGKKDDKEPNGAPKPKRTSSKRLSASESGESSEFDTNPKKAAQSSGGKTEEAASTILPSSAAISQNITSKDSTQKDPPVTAQSPATRTTGVGTDSKPSSKDTKRPGITRSDVPNQKNFKPEAIQTINAPEGSLSHFLEGSKHSRRSDAQRQNLDDSFAVIADNLQRQPIESQMAEEKWRKGDTIPNWMGWADQVIKASDTESVQGFEKSRDLNDLNDFDDDSTIATNFDDMSFASVTTPAGANSAYVTFEEPAEPAESTPTVTPAKVAASILFTDSPVGSVDQTPARSNLQRGQDHLIDMGLTFATEDAGLDAGLSFGADDVGFDDGLGFGGDPGLGGFGMPPIPAEYAKDDKSPDRKKKWFAWGNKK